jgi:hypothetical protein
MRGYSGAADSETAAKQDEYRNISGIKCRTKD